MARNLVAALLALLLSLFVVGCGEPETDAQRLGTILRTVASQSQLAERAYDKALAASESVKSGKPMNLAAQEMEEQAAVIDVVVIDIARLVETKAKEINHAAARENTEKGLRGLHAVNRVRRDFLSEFAAAIQTADVQRMRAVSRKYEDELPQLMPMALMSLAHFSGAKQALGLPMTLDEFK